MTPEQQHLQLFMTRVRKMRDLQKRYFAGDRNVLSEARKAESAVDNAVKKLLEMGYVMQEEKQVEQTKLL